MIDEGLELDCNKKKSEISYGSVVVVAAAESHHVYDCTRIISVGRNQQRATQKKAAHMAAVRMSRTLDTRRVTSAISMTLDKQECRAGPNNGECSTTFQSQISTGHFY